MAKFREAAVKLRQFSWYWCYAFVPSTMGYAFAVIVAFGFSAPTAATLFFGIAMANTVRFTFSPQTTHWLPKKMAAFSAPQAAAGLKHVVLFELAVAVATFAVFWVTIFLFTRISDSYSLANLLPFGIFVFSSIIPLFSTIQRQWVSIRVPTVFMVLYWLGRVGLVAVFVLLEIPEASFIVALVCFEAMAYLIAIGLIVRLLLIMRRPLIDGPSAQFLDWSTIRLALGRSVLRGSLREADIICAGLIGLPNVLVEYRIVRSLALALMRGLGPIIDLAFVKLSKMSTESIDRTWQRQKQVATWVFVLVILAVIPLVSFGSAWTEEPIARILRLETPGMPTVFLILFLTGFVQVFFIALYPLAMQYGLYYLMFISSLGGAMLFIPLLILSVQMQMISVLAASYLTYICTILAINFFGIKRYAG